MATDRELQGLFNLVASHHRKLGKTMHWTCFKQQAVYNYIAAESRNLLEGYAAVRAGATWLAEQVIGRAIDAIPAGKLVKMALEKLASDARLAERVGRKLANWSVGALSQETRLMNVHGRYCKNRRSCPRWKSPVGRVSLSPTNLAKLELLDEAYNAQTSTAEIKIRYRFNDGEEEKGTVASGGSYASIIYHHYWSDGDNDATVRLTNIPIQDARLAYVKLDGPAGYGVGVWFEPRK